MEFWHGPCTQFYVLTNSAMICITLSAQIKIENMQWKVGDWKTKELCDIAHFMNGKNLYGTQLIYQYISTET